MKLFGLFLITFVCVAFLCSAQQEQPLRTISNHSAHISAGVFNFNASAGYTYEWAFARKWTLLGSAGLKGEFSWGSSFWDDYSTFLLFPAISAEPRFYYNLNKRSHKRKSTFLNSGGYIGGTLSCFFPSIYGKDGIERDFFHGGISPHWGCRKVFNNHLLLDFHAGIIILFGNGETVWGPDFNLKFGYVF